MHIVALTRWGRPMDEELPTLAGWLGLTAYDLRLRLAGALPAVFQVLPDEAKARELCQALRARGHGAVAVDQREVRGPNDQVVARDFTFGPESLEGVDQSARPFAMPYADMVALLRAASVSTAQRTIASQEKKLAVGRAVLSGGMVARKTVHKSSQVENEQREQILYVFGRRAPAPLVFRAQSLRYEGLGADLGVASLANFTTLVTKLRALAPHALGDDRLLTHKRKVGLASVSGQSTDRLVETSNASTNDLAAWLLVRALLEAQL